MIGDGTFRNDARPVSPLQTRWDRVPSLINLLIKLQNQGICMWFGVCGHIGDLCSRGSRICPCHEHRLAQFIQYIITTCRTAHVRVWHWGQGYVTGIKPKMVKLTRCGNPGSMILVVEVTSHVMMPNPSSPDRGKITGTLFILA